MLLLYTSYFHFTLYLWTDEGKASEVKWSHMIDDDLFVERYMLPALFLMFYK